MFRLWTGENVEKKKIYIENTVCHMTADYVSNIWFQSLNYMFMCVSSISFVPIDRLETSYERRVMGNYLLLHFLIFWQLAIFVISNTMMWISEAGKTLCLLLNIRSTCVV
jgi:hypothetical protein